VRHPTAHQARRSRISSTNINISNVRNYYNNCSHTYTQIGFMNIGNRSKTTNIQLRSGHRTRKKKASLMRSPVYPSTSNWGSVSSSSSSDFDFWFWSIRLSCGTGEPYDGMLDSSLTWVSAVCHYWMPWWGSSTFTLKPLPLPAPTLESIVH
jgi:hypothetical protein